MPKPASRLLGPALLALALTPLLATAVVPPRFPAGAVWHQNIADAPLHPQSRAMLETLAGLGGWGNSNRMQIDFSLHVHHTAPADAPRYEVIPHRGSGEYWRPDCEALPTTMPVPADAAFEGQSGLTCNSANSDCHLLVRQGSKLYELYSGNLSGGVLDARCLTVWDLSVVYPPEGRGEHCTSADAAGFPVAPLLVNADEVAARAGDANGDLGHAIRFILPNARMATDPALGGVGGRLYVRPASHAGGPSGPRGSVPYGVRMRLRPDFDMAGYNPAARVILRTMQRYGLVLADGGNIALTFESDRHTTAKWSTLGITSQIFWNGTGGAAPVKVTDFQIIDTGPRIGETWNCVRSVALPSIEIFLNGFDPA
ncbi:hypothetical protein [Dokdonella koreensis]|uniref:Phosphodiester glycosidase domain-containing protein n=1 Tax=Dokdonella koreensis DS-123 TaxID=1300342 RepID=A0A160DT55_9GAMM|nr:hypothetical protein [Dokdonella koreensis]ANB17528.1 Hypothetical protein I596_1502 [Dokdonella koreensis DS-123]